MSISSVSSLIDVLRRYHLLEPEQLDELARGAAVEQPKALAADLIRRGWLTPYQANQILQGRARELVLGSYVPLERLGEGGMGQVFKARNWKLGRLAALKLIRKERLINEEAVRRFHREMRAAAHLCHPNIVLAYDAGEDNGTHFFTMEYVEGQDLARVVGRHGPLPVAAACDYIRQAALGLQHAHEKGLVHRDVKPHNLLLSKQGVVKLLDLGLAQFGASGDDEGSSTLTREGVVMGTVDYIAPEQVADSHAVDIRADLYSLGCTLFFLLTGRVPFPGGKPMEKLYPHRHELPPPVQGLRPEVPGAVAAVVRKLLAKQPQDRYQTPAELAVALTPESLAAWTAPEVAETLPDLGVPAGVREASRDTDRSVFTDLHPASAADGRGAARKPLLLLGGVGLLVLLGVGVAAYSFLGHTPRAKEEPTPGAPRKPEVREARAVLKGHAGPVLSLAWMAVLASGSQDGTVKLWGVAGGRPLATLGGGRKASALALAFSPDGKNLVSSDGQTLHVWDPVAFTERTQFDTTHPATVRALAFDFRSSNQVQTVGDDNSWQWWGIQDSKRWGIRYLPVEAWSVACSAQADHFAVGLANGTVHCSNHAMKEEFNHLGHRGPVKALTYSPNGRLLASGGADGVIKLWDVATGKDQGTLEGHKGAVESLAFSPDGKTLASASADGTVRLWGVVSGKEKASLPGHPRGTGAVAFSPDGKTLAAGEFDGTVRLWDLPAAETAGK
jgi:tRNA A-37 threonylcarbamoyl transferase component Bud32